MGHMVLSGTLCPFLLLECSLGKDWTAEALHFMLQKLTCKWESSSSKVPTAASKPKGQQPSCPSPDWILPLWSFAVFTHNPIHWAACILKKALACALIFYVSTQMHLHSSTTKWAQSLHPYPLVCFSLHQYWVSPTLVPQSHLDFQSEKGKWHFKNQSWQNH